MGEEGQGSEPRWVFSFMNAPKITEMNREELRDYMRASREILKFDQYNKAWQRAFELARKSGLENMDMDCTTCRRKVLEWLTR